MSHPNQHPLAGKTVRIKSGTFKDFPYRLEDWWDRLSHENKSWMDCDGNPACMKYAIRTGMSSVPIPNDDEVVYGKIGPLGHLVHVSELGEEINESPTCTP